MDFSGKIELHESSGPVSPRYQYSIDLVITIAAGAANVTCNRGGDDVTAEVPAERTAKLLAALDAHDLANLGGDLVEDKLGRVGVSFNHVLIGKDGSAEIRLDYLLPRMAQPENAKRKAFVDFLKAFADEVTPVPAQAPPAVETPLVVAPPPAVDGPPAVAAAAAPPAAVAASPAEGAKPTPKG